MPSGGKREGAGRKPTGLPPMIRRSISFTREEWNIIQLNAKHEGISASEYIRRKVFKC